MTKTLLLVDYSNVMHRSIAVKKDLFSYNGRYTGGLYGFISQISKAINDFIPTNLLICKDTKPYLRSKEYEDYGTFKKRDNPNEVDGDTNFIGESITYIDEFLEKFNIPTVGSVGYEADDYIALAVKKFHQDYDRIIILSNDDDLYQLMIHDNVFVAKKKGLYGKQEFIEEFEIDPLKWVDVTAMSGTHNSIEGIPRIGYKTAIKLLKKKGVKLLEVQEKNSELIERNRGLITLPHKTLTELVVDLEIPPFTERKFLNYLLSYEISMTSAMSRAFSNLGGN